MKITVITLAQGRHRHLAAQQQALLLSSRPVDDYVVVAMNDPDIGARVRDPRLPGTVLNVPASGSSLPLANARNAGARAALERGAGLLVFLDVDCLPGTDLVAGYAAAAEQADGRLLCGPVTYLDPPGPDGYDLIRLQDLDAPHPARPAPEPGSIVPDGNPDLFWSLSFAVTVETWQRIGGFCEDYTGYGGEDTDFARLAGQKGVGLAWVGGARAYHQWHPTQDPPVQHLADIVRNANLFHERWGSWPMGGWLEGFRRRGLIRGGTGSEPCALSESVPLPG
ncbi:glycosyltransferase family 2 protein [Arthrobacter sp. Sa2CUA1]|uniref:Glycosyltransferase family 2 protein n=1 Tax=Arthrobacter gallicola TaxID=2762225 RepID=A0ABR8UQG5_9MICC|nr:galactosyltransferase-related protein [Arthrobacter gallicola]MBD7994783.1 glycosyltransferase family 2 protein [Arthrobacter gallicola]